MVDLVKKGKVIEEVCIKAGALLEIITNSYKFDSSLNS